MGNGGSRFRPGSSRAASQDMAGGEKAPSRGTLPAATLKLLGMELTSFGEATAEDPAIIVRRFVDEKAGINRKAVVRDNALSGAILLNDVSSFMLLRELISSKRDAPQVKERLLDGSAGRRGFVAGKPVEQALRSAGPYRARRIGRGRPGGFALPGAGPASCCFRFLISERQDANYSGREHNAQERGGHHHIPAIEIAITCMKGEE
jgi:hypothetical protein